MPTDKPMQLGMIGLGRMGANIVRRLMRDGHECVAYARHKTSVDPLVADGATPASSLADLVAKLAKPRNVWVMVPAGAATESVVTELGALLEPDDVLIDGGNSRYHDDIRRSSVLAKKGTHFLDCGTSGGVWGLERGYCLMIGGDTSAVNRMVPIWDTIAPGMGDVSRTPGRVGEPIPAERGWLHCGPSGAGHFVKMTHNGIEYGLMAAYAEGLNILKRANAGNQQRDQDAETAPLENPEFYKYDLDIAAITELWRRGSVVASWLLDLTAAALVKSPTLDEFGGRVSDSGEGRWTCQAAIDTGTPAPVLSSALYSRLMSQGNARFADQVQSAMRKEFGGHDEKTG
ncbi:MAG: decarboxylating 6-phosphogluconate dehydrogenase [Candidatus Nanopelagicales bacterium]|nr:decarboxylating 6-phosphogluconate dehydrogenase [Candidatus Nanopelagicales bacterium]MDZ4250076.1 decarboxylating 6-phosphogluconate dehydrogenase [Candidatus Nanopelagicales bacterium]